MSQAYLRTLGWLPRAASDFRARCSALRAAGGTAGTVAELRALAAGALDSGQLQRLAGVLDGLRSTGADLSPLTPFRLALVGNGTLDFIAPALVATAARHGLALECLRTPYGQAMQQALDPDSALCRARPDAVLVALDHRALPLRAPVGDEPAAAAAVAASLAQLDALREAFARHCGALTILQTLATPVEPLFGSHDPLVAGTPRQLIEALNRGIIGRVAAHPSTSALLDVAALAGAVGCAEWFSPAQWNLAQLPFADACVPLYAEHVARLIAALRGKARRCLVLDLDHTLWGGIIGDDGLEGIRLAPGDAVGEAHLAVQRLALALRARGIVLAVSSKNEDATARLPFRDHPDMLLREEHIAVFQANWQDKATNISAIARTLSLGLDAFVFLDDNPAERALVRTTLPEVAVPELPEDPALYAFALSAAGYFESITLSAEDRQRAAYYEGNARRVALQAQVADLDAYLASLAMEITFAPFDEVGRARIAQLINKSNQFNLTTRRYTEAEVAAAQAEPGGLTLQVRLTDSIGDNGMISVVICRAEPGGVWAIDSWLMSCRVLGRRVEHMVLHELGRQAAAAGITRLRGEFRPTGRNELVRDHYRSLGFTRLEERADGSSLWELELPVTVPMAPMIVHRRGFAR